MGFSSRNAGEQAAMKLCANNSCTVRPSHGPEPTTMDRSASGGWVLGAEKVVSMRMSVSSRACEKDASRGSSSSLAKNGGTFSRMMVRP